MPDPIQTARDDAIRVAMMKFDEIISEHAAADRQEEAGKAWVAEGQKRKATVYQQYDQLMAMAALFGFDLVAEHKAQAVRQHDLTPEIPPRSPPTVTTLAAAIAAGESPKKTIKRHVVEAAQQAYPNAIRASAMRRQLEMLGIEVHEKTVGMTMYRLQTKGILRREGWDWFFVPADMRQGEEDPGDEPGLQLDAAE